VATLSKVEQSRVMQELQLKHRAELAEQAQRIKDAMLRRQEENLMSESAVQQMSKPCPRCLTAIARDGGCRHMTCTRCHFEFFWCCLRAFRDRDQERAHLQDPVCNRIQ
jgi:hypothetical protein